MKNNNSDPQPQGSFFQKNLGQLYEFYLSGPIEAPETYIEWFDSIRNARETDIVKIYINSPGGDLYTAIQFLRVMAESEATIICSVEGACMSAATMVFLAGHQHEITPHSMFMFHNYSAGVFGKGGEMYDQIQFEHAWSENFLKEVYKNFLTEEEISAMLHNKDIWLTSSEVINRLQALYEEQEAEVEQALSKQAKAEIIED